MRMRWLAALLFAGGLAAGLGAGLTRTAHASGPARPARPWNEIFLPFGNGTGTAMCVDVPGGTSAPGARLQLVPQGRESRGGHRHVMLETSGPGGPALCMTAGNLSDENHTPLVAAPCQGFGNAAEILELG